MHLSKSGRDEICLHKNAGDFSCKVSDNFEKHLTRLHSSVQKIKSNFNKAYQDENEFLSLVLQTEGMWYGMPIFKPTRKPVLRRKR